MSSICPQPLCFPLDGTSSFPLGEMCDVDCSDSCALMEREDRLSGVQSHSCNPAIHFHYYACQESGIFSNRLPNVTSKCNLFQFLLSKKKEKKGCRLNGCMVALLEKKKKTLTTRQSMMLLSNFSSCEIYR